MAYVISICNHKGGVGKTTTAVNIGAGLAKRGYKVLLVDMDAQANLTDTLHASAETDIYAMLRGATPTPVVINENLHVLPSTLELAAAEVELSTAIGREALLKEVIQPLKKQYNYIIIDTAPTLGLLTINAMAASDYAIIPMQAEYYALKGIRGLLDVITNVQKRINKALKIGDGWGGNNPYGFQNMSIDEYRITRRALAPQEFLMTGASVDQTALEPMRTWFRFEGNLGAEPSEGAIPAGAFMASTVTMTYSPVVPGVRIVDGNGNVVRATNTSSMYFSGAHGSGESSSDTANQRLLFARNLLLEKDMKSMTVEFFMKGTKNEAKAWASILRMYGNATGSDSSPFRRLWSVGYKNANGALYVIKDYKGAAPKAIFYPDDNVSFADGHWHHIAVTFAPDGNGNTLCTFYRDYQQLGSQFTFDGEMECGDYGTSSLAMGSRYNGHLDEVRISKGVLTVDQMMHVIKCGTVISVR